MTALNARPIAVLANLLRDVDASPPERREAGGGLCLRGGARAGHRVPAHRRLRHRPRAD